MLFASICAFINWYQIFCVCSTWTSAHAVCHALREKYPAYHLVQVMLTTRWWALHFQCFPILFASVREVENRYQIFVCVQNKPLSIHFVVDYNKNIQQIIWSKLCCSQNDQFCVFLIFSHFLNIVCIRTGICKQIPNICLCAKQSSANADCRGLQPKYPAYLIVEAMLPTKWRVLRCLLFSIFSNIVCIGTGICKPISNSCLCVKQTSAHLDCHGLQPKYPAYLIVEAMLPTKWWVSRFLLFSIFFNIVCIGTGICKLISKNVRCTKCSSVHAVGHRLWQNNRSYHIRWHMVS